MTASPRPRSFRVWFLYLGVVALIGYGVWYAVFRPAPDKGRYPMPAWAGTGRPQATPVRTVLVTQRDLDLYLKAIGTVTALNTVTVRSQVEGTLIEVSFAEGEKVEAGQLLARIDPAPYEARAAQAEGLLRQAEARLATAQSDLARIQELHTRKLVTDQDRDLQAALVLEREGALLSARAQWDDARLRLGYTRITAPVAGRTGLRRMDVGNLVREGDSAGLLVLTQTQPITVSFTIPESALHSVLLPFRQGERLRAEAWDREERTLLATGQLENVDNQIDAATGTLRLRAVFPNEPEVLFPNQFVNLRLKLRTVPSAVVIPEAAIQFGARGPYVYIITPEQRAKVRDVKLGPVEGEWQIIEQGLAVGEQIALEGLDRLRDDHPVVIANPGQPVSLPPAAPKP